MPGNTFGKLFRVTTFGESHGIALGTIVDGLPSGVKIDRSFIAGEMRRRRPGGNEFSTTRSEDDEFEILSGVKDGVSTGSPIAMIVYNKNQRSGDYKEIEDLFRPGHADYTYYKKYGIRDARGGGRSSGRETLSRVLAGSLAKLYLREKGIEIKSAVRSVKDIVAKGAFRTDVKPPLYFIDEDKNDEIEALIKKTRSECDSLGGIVECHIYGVPAGLGEPVFDKAESVLAHAMMSIGAVKGISFGLGFQSTLLFGSENNDQMDENGMRSNNAGGILGGITTGEEIYFSLAVKPTPSIAKEQDTIDIYGHERKISVKGRHDPVILFRILPVVESMAAISIMNLYLENIR